jgi:DNA-binding CsgD family transcriptional regulator
MIRPILEATLVMPSLFGVLEHSTPYRILTRMNFDFVAQKPPKMAVANSFELSRREQEIIKLIYRGLRNQEVADRLNISIFTVKTHLSNIYRKLEVRNRTSMLNKIQNLNILTL